MAAVVLKAKRDKSLRRHHPWIFSGAIAAVKGKPESGETLDILTQEGECLGRGAYSPQSQITVKVWTFNPGEQIDTNFFNRRLQAAIRAREFLFNRSASFQRASSWNPEEKWIPDNRFAISGMTAASAYRLVNAESDGLPGVIADRYGNFLVCQFLSAGAEYWKTVIVEQLKMLVSCEGIYERSDVEVRKKENLPLITGVLYGKEPPDELIIEESGLKFGVDVKAGHKTGFYLDQRINRQLCSQYVAAAEVLNCFAYTGGFCLAALKGKAKKVVNVEASASALQLLQRNLELNQFSAAAVENHEADVFKLLRHFREQNRQFDVIILDPPKFADSKGQLERASRGYKDINWLAFRLLKPGGLLFTFSCSGLMSSDLFQKIVADAVLDAQREAHIIQHLYQAPDHTTALNFPEAQYLKGLICRVQ